MPIESMPVLVVDDEVRPARSLARGLSAGGFVVDLAHGGITGRDITLHGGP